MPDSQADQLNKYPLQAYYFSVTIDNEVYRFQEVSGLSVEYGVIKYAHGLSPKEGYIKMPGKGTAANVSLKRGLMRRGDQLLKWISTIKLNQVQKKDILVSLIDHDDNPVVSWTVVNAFPTKLTAPTLDATSESVALETLDLIADDVKIEFLS